MAKPKNKMKKIQRLEKSLGKFMENKVEFRKVELKIQTLKNTAGR